MKIVSIGKMPRQQVDSSDCGIHMLQASRHLMDLRGPGTNFTLDQENIQLFRYLILGNAFES